MVRTPKIPTALWPPDDTEVSILGVPRHQLDIIALHLGLHELAVTAAAGGPLPWQVISQIMLLGYLRPNGSAYTVFPDVAVFPQPLELDRGSFTLDRDGPPLLVVEVASPSTVQADLDLRAGKGWTYARAEVAEYLVLDPTGDLIPELGRGWRLTNGVYEPWHLDELGHWWSAMIGSAFGVHDGLAAVYDLSGRQQVRIGEITETIADRERAGREQGERSGREQGERSGLAEGLRRGRDEGLTEGKRAGEIAGRIAGKREVVRQVARARFGEAPSLEARIDSATEAGLDSLLGRLMSSSSVNDL
jgi:hypothetical protein